MRNSRKTNPRSGPLAGWLPVTLVAGLASAAFLTAAHAQTPVSTWAATYGFGSYNSAGNPQTSDDDYDLGTDFANTIAPMPDGGVVVGGTFDLPELYLNQGGSTHTGDGVSGVIRYAADGTILWQVALRQENDLPVGPNGYSEYARTNVQRVLTNAQGNVYVAFYKGGLGLYRRPSFANFSSAGVLIWQRSFQGNRYYTGNTASNGQPETLATDAGSFRYVLVVADPDNALAERNEGNNMVVVDLSEDVPK